MEEFALGFLLGVFVASILWGIFLDWMNKDWCEYSIKQAKEAIDECYDRFEAIYLTMDYYRFRSNNLAKQTYIIMRTNKF